MRGLYSLLRLLSILLWGPGCLSTQQWTNTEFESDIGQVTSLLLNGAAHVDYTEKQANQHSPIDLDHP